MKQSYNDEIKQTAILFEKAMADHTTPYFDASELSLLSYYYEDKENPERALEATNYGLKLHPDNFELLIQKGYLLLKIMGTDSALNLVHSLPDQNNPEVILLRTQIRLEEGAFDQAEALLDSLPIHQLNSSYLVNETAFLYNELGKSEKALPFVQNFLTTHPDDNEALLTLSQIKFNLCEYEQSLEISTKLSELDPYNLTNWELIINSNFQIGRLEQALEATDLALAINPESSTTHISKAHCLFSLHQFKEAIAEYQKGLEGAPVLTATTYFYIGLCFCELNQNDKAIENLKKATTNISPIEAEFESQIYYALIKVLCESNRMDEAIDIYLKAVNLSPFDHHFIEALIRGYNSYYQGNFAESFEAFITALESYPDIGYYSDIISLFANNEKLDYALKTIEHCKSHLEEYEWEILTPKIAAIELFSELALKNGIALSEITYQKLDELMAKDYNYSNRLIQLQQGLKDSVIEDQSTAKETDEINPIYQFFIN